MWGILRLILALTVVTFHSTFLSGTTSHFFTPGDMFVEMFFTISGFVITKAIRRNYATGWSGFIRFWQNRILRLFPPYWVALIIGLMVVPVAFHWNIKMSWPRGAEWFSAILIAGQAGLLSPDGGLGSDPLLATWSLSVELFYYVLLSTWAARSLRNSAIFLMISIVIALTFGVHISITAMYFGILWQCLPFSIGCFLAWANFPIRLKPTVSILMVGLALIYLWFIPQTPKTLYLCSLVSAVAIIACESIPQGRFDHFLGELSYPTYIIQFPVMALLRHLHGWDYTIASVLGALGAGLLIHIMVELPMQAMRTRIRLGRSSGPVGAAFEQEAS